jgi:ABC-2 type transport system ATP-binding protein
VRYESGTTIFLTTHYLEEAEEADKICMINNGRILSFGSPQQVKANLIEHYLLIDAENRDQLLVELQRLGIEFSETPLFKISLNERSTQELIKMIDTPLTLVKTHNPTLEDAYLEIMEHA